MGLTPIRGITVVGDQVYANLENLGPYTADRTGGSSTKLSVLKSGQAATRAPGLSLDEQAP
jgi:hypothetical protein